MTTRPGAMANKCPCCKRSTHELTVLGDTQNTSNNSFRPGKKNRQINEIQLNVNSLNKATIFHTGRLHSWFLEWPLHSYLQSTQPVTLDVKAKQVPAIGLVIVEVIMV